MIFEIIYKAGLSLLVLKGSLLLNLATRVKLGFNLLCARRITTGQPWMVDNVDDGLSCLGARLKQVGDQVFEVL